MNFQMIPMRVLGDDRGSLVAVEAEKDVPFAIARVYYIFGTREGVERGFHAHKILQQLAVAVRGSCTMLLDDGKEKVEIKLDAPDKGMYIGPGIWREMKDFTEDCVLLVFADQHYDEADYLRKYEDFLAFLQTAKQ